MKPIVVVAWLCLAVTLAAGSPVLDEDASAAASVQRGRTQFMFRCGGCHALDVNRSGPSLRGVVGRPAGSLGKFGYSSSLARSGLVWSEQTLDQWLTAPSRLVPGTRMTATVKSAEDRHALIAYLRSVAR